MDHCGFAGLFTVRDGSGMNTGRREGGTRVKNLGRAALAALTLAFCLTAGVGLSGCAAFKAKSGEPTTAKAGSSASLAAGDAALARGDRTEAGRNYIAALKTGADAATVHTRLGDLLLSEMPDKARLEYEKALKANPKYGPAWQGLGFALYLGGAEAEAAEALAKALERDPGLPRAAALLGVIENRRGRPEAALAVLDKTLAVAFDPDVENNRGLSLMLLGRSDEAADAFRKALAAKKSPKIANNLGLTLCRLHRYDEAYAAFASVNSESAALNNLGVCFMEAGDKTRAHQYFERAIAANPAYYQKAQANLSRLSAMEEVNLPSSAQPSSAAPAQMPQPAPAQAVQPSAPMAAPVRASAPASAAQRPSASEKVDRSERP
jgi:tetratricopeptide (TPR) repeat protein